VPEITQICVISGVSVHQSLGRRVTGCDSPGSHRGAGDALPLADLDPAGGLADTLRGGPHLVRPDGHVAAVGPRFEPGALARRCAPRLRPVRMSLLSLTAPSGQR
jgi:hypothetical protein